MSAATQRISPLLPSEAFLTFNTARLAVEPGVEPLNPAMRARMFAQTE
jgi:hypothetical protein